MFFNPLTRMRNKTRPSKKMIVNVLHAEQSRVAIVEEGVLTDLSLEATHKEKNRGNIYMGIVRRVEPSLHAAFVDYGYGRPGFLPLDEVQPMYHSQKTGKLTPDKILRKNQNVLVQVVKEEQGTKGASLTTYVSLPGRYLVIMPGYNRTGVSRKIEDEAERKKLKDIGKQLKLPDAMGFIIRTAGLNKNKKDLQRDVNYLLRLWKAIESRSKDLSAPCLIYQESSMVIQAIRDYFTTDISEVLVDSPDVFKKIKEFFKQVIPKHHKIVKLYENPNPIFLEHGIEKQIESLYSRCVALKSGGSISIDPTEALVAIDVNTARFTRPKDPEETVLITNLEAADEIARQLRLRDLGGLIVIDFIDMKSPKNRLQVERHLRQAFKVDKANVELSKISKFGMLEMSREHLRTPLFDSSHMDCACCGGRGKIRSRESLALTLLNDIYRLAATGSHAEIHLTMDPGAAAYLLNYKRNELAAVEREFHTNVIIQSQVMTPADSYILDSGQRGQNSNTKPSHTKP